MLKQKLILLLLLIVIVPGCSVHKAVFVGSGFTVPKTEDTATAIISLTLSGVHDVPFMIYYRGTDESNRSKKGFFPVRHQRDWPVPTTKNMANALNNYSGRLMVMTLPAGNYEFYALVIDDGYREGSWGSGGKYSIPFSLSQGKANYIGNVHFHSGEIGNNLMHLQSESYLFNKTDRDMGLFYDKFPKVDKSDVVLSPTINNVNPNDKIVRMHHGQESSGRRIF
jgi:hypothetical protein